MRCFQSLPVGATLCWMPKNNYSRFMSEDFHRDSEMETDGAKGGNSKYWAADKMKKQKLL